MQDDEGVLEYTYIGPVASLIPTSERMFYFDKHITYQK